MSSTTLCQKQEEWKKRYIDFLIKNLSTITTVCILTHCVVHFSIIAIGVFNALNICGVSQCQVCTSISLHIFFLHITGGIFDENLLIFGCWTTFYQSFHCDRWVTLLIFKFIHLVSWSPSTSALQPPCPRGGSETLVYLHICYIVTIYFTHGFWCWMGILYVWTMLKSHC